MFWGGGWGFLELNFKMYLCFIYAGCLKQFNNFQTFFFNYFLHFYKDFQFNFKRENYLKR